MYTTTCCRFTWSAWIPAEEARNPEDGLQDCCCRWWEGSSMACQLWGVLAEITTSGAYMLYPAIIVRYMLSCLMSLDFVDRRVLTWLKRGSTQELLWSWKQFFKRLLSKRHLPDSIIQVLIRTFLCHLPVYRWFFALNSYWIDGAVQFPLPWRPSQTLCDHHPKVNIWH